MYTLIEDRKHDVEEDTYHGNIENQLISLGWAPWRGEIKHKPSLRIGNRGSMQPDILVSRDGEDQFVIEVKRPNHSQLGEDINQLESYMRQLKLEVGLYIGERLEIFYDKPGSKHVVSVMKISLDLDEKRGSRFVELFSKEGFSKKEIVEFCEERLREIKRQASLNNIRDSLIANAQTQISESLRPYLMDKYGNTFSEDEIKGMLSQLRFTASATNAKQSMPIVSPDNKPVHQHNIIKCHLTRNAEAYGLFNLENESLTVLKGSRVNAQSLTIEVKNKRDKQLEKYTEEKGGQRIVKQDVLFLSPSGAAVFCVGGSSNGWNTWKDEQGRKLSAYITETRKSTLPARTDSFPKEKDYRQFLLDFWTRLRDKLKATQQIPTLQSPLKRSGYDVRIGRSNILVSNRCSVLKNTLGVRLYIRPEGVATYYPALEARKAEINSALGCNPAWDANPSSQSKTISTSYHTDLTDPLKVEEALEWMLKQNLNFYRVFSEEVKNI